MRVRTFVFALSVVVACLGFAVGASASANPPGPGAHPVTVDEGRPKCPPHAAPSACTAPVKRFPQKHPYSDCRWTPYYPTVEAQVHCVMVYNGQSGNWTIWACIGYRESHWVPTAIGAAGERGIFQIHPVNFWRFESWRLFDPVYNAYAAVVLWRLVGFSPWTTGGSCGV